MTEADPQAGRLGAHLRRVRKQKGLSLLDVQSLSADEFKASVLGAYERGERAISTARLARLAELYRLPVAAMFPADGGRESGGPVVLDVNRLDRATSAEARTVARFVRRLQARRAETATGAIRIRNDDLVALACALDRSPADLVSLLDDQGLRV